MEVSRQSMLCKHCVFCSRLTFSEKETTTRRRERELSFTLFSRLVKETRRRKQELLTFSTLFLLLFSLSFTFNNTWKVVSQVETRQVNSFLPPLSTSRLFSTCCSSHRTACREISRLITHCTSPFSCMRLKREKNRVNKK